MSKKNQGEGNRDAAREYNDEVKKFVDEKRVEPAAKRAKDYVDAHPVEAARDEAAGQAGPNPVAQRLDDLVAEGRAMYERAKKRVKSWLVRD